ncbi:MAG: hypothetical protein QM767_19510 [Anaeromyxobacter sp.]
MPPAPLRPRVHVVLVPGFAGFDALGQLEYYAGVTPLLQPWQAAHPDAPPVVLHYFDNLPTAGVATRAARLLRFLARRHARGEIQDGERIALIGHSTGGLDIRRLLRDLAAGAGCPVDGDRQDAVRVDAAALLAHLERVVFLSVPQRGTPLADLVRRLPLAWAIAQAQLWVKAGRLHLANDLEEAAARWLGRGARADLVLAAADAISEMDAAAVAGDPSRRAEAHEAAAALDLYLTLIGSDLAAIEDLTAVPGPASASPAHASEPARAAERQAWAAHGLRTRSYATRGRRPFTFGPGEAVPPWDLLRPSTSPWARLAAGAADETDLVYRCGYRACAGAPDAAPPIPEPLRATSFEDGAQVALEPWDGDGIVGTASMLWPDGPETRLVAADHGDVIGHFRLVEEPEGPPLRRYHTYDLLRSGSGFTADAFRRLWGEVLDFCVS